MKKVILTGGTGFVGSNLARRLLKLGHEVHLLVRPSFNPWRIQGVRDNIRVHELEFSDKTAVANAVNEIKPEWIFHLAAHGAYSWQKDVAEIFETNLMGTVHLLEACLKTGFESFIHTGSSSEYGFKDHAPAETEWVEPNSHYACAKVAATQYCRYTAQKEKANVVTLRLYSAYGPYEEPNRLIPTLIREGFQGKLPPLVNPETSRDYVHVDDVCSACIQAARKQAGEFGAVFNVGTGTQTTLSEVVQTVRGLMQLRVEPEWGSMPSRNWDTSIWVSDSEKIQQELGWIPAHTLESGLSDSIAWYRANTGALQGKGS